MRFVRIKWVLGRFSLDDAVDFIAIIRNFSADTKSKILMASRLS